MAAQARLVGCAGSGAPDTACASSYSTISEYTEPCTHLPNPENSATMLRGTSWGQYDARPIIAAEVRRVLLMRIHSNHMSSPYRFFNEVFRTLQAERSSITFLVTCRTRVSRAVRSIIGDCASEGGRPATSFADIFDSMRNLDSVGIGDFVPEMLSLKLTFRKSGLPPGYWTDSRSP